jgi:PKD repeat protein
MKKLKPFFIGPILLMLLFACEKAPVADFSFSNPVEVGELVWFTNLSSNCDSYSWNFGDGLASTDELPSHVYEKPGTYTISLTANGGGGSASIEKVINVNGTTYSIRNSTSFAFTDFCSFYWNGSDLVDYIGHGPLAVGGSTGIVITNKNEISFGLVLMGTTYVSVNPFILTMNTHNNLVIDNYTEIYGEGKGAALRVDDIKILDKKLTEIEEKLK